MEQWGWRERLEHFWLYYRIPFLAAVFICIAVCYFVYAKVTEKDHALNAVFLDIHADVQEDTLEKEFLEYAGIDGKEQEAEISTSLLFSDAGSGNYTMASLAKIYTQIGTEELDVCMLLEEDFEQYAQAGTFLDLREVFTPEELGAFPELYVDTEGRVLGVSGEGLKKIEEIGGYPGEEKKGIAGIVYNTRHKDTAGKFLEYLREG